MYVATFLGGMASLNCDPGTRVICKVGVVSKFGFHGLQAPSTHPVASASRFAAVLLYASGLVMLA